MKPPPNGPSEHLQPEWLWKVLVHNSTTTQVLVIVMYHLFQPPTVPSEVNDLCASRRQLLSQDPTWVEAHYPFGIHGTNGIFTHGEWHKFMVNVGKYSSPMDPIGIENPSVCGWNIMETEKKHPTNLSRTKMTN